MRYYHRHSFFPLVVIVLTLLLCALMALTLVSRGEPAQFVEEEAAVVDAGNYRDSITTVVREFKNKFAQAVDSAGQKRAGAQALQTLLNLRVPAEYKTLHLDLAVFLSSVESGSAISDPLGTLQTIVETYSWLTL